jgi:hypothetical protein
MNDPVGLWPRACVDNEVELGVLKALAIVPRHSVMLSLLRRRQPLSRRKEGHSSVVRDALKG